MNEEKRKGMNENGTNPCFVLFVCINGVWMWKKQGNGGKWEEEEEEEMKEISEICLCVKLK